MNGPGEIPITNGSTAAERPCGLTSLIPTIGMSCRGRAEAFARRLQCKLRTLGVQSNDSPTNEEDPIIGLSTNTWISHDTSQNHVTNHQPLRSTSTEADSYFDFDCDLESPGSPVDECEYSRLIETAATTPHDCPTESGCICTTPLSPKSHEDSQSSTDEPFYDPEISDGEQRSLPTDYYDCETDSKQDIIVVDSVKYCNDHIDDDKMTKYLQSDSSESLSDSLPPSQESTSANTPSLTHPSYTFTGVTSVSSNTLQDDVLSELQQQSNIVNLKNGHHYNEENEESEKRITTTTNGEVEKCNDKNEITVKEDKDSNRHQCENGSLENGHETEKPLTNGYHEDENLTNGYNHYISEDSQVCENDKLASHHHEKESQRPIQLGISSKSNNNANKNNLNDITNGKKHLSSSDDDDDDDDGRPQRVRRCSSLKTGKTPPGTPGRKKIVRFADALGLDLADVKTFLDEIPTVPKSAYEDLEINEMEPPIQLGPKIDKILVPMFQQVGGLPTFLDIVRDRQVCLENAAVTDPINMTITGCVRVRNLDFHKSVYVRYTIDGWRNFVEIQAAYVPNSCDGFSDKFTFTIYGNSLVPGQRLELAARFHCKGQQYWDNNYGTNYCFQCLPSTNPSNARSFMYPHVPILSPADTWCGNFY